jgi:hypothetical protein
MYKPIAMNCAPDAIGVLHGSGVPEGAAEGAADEGAVVEPAAGVALALGWGL